MIQPIQASQNATSMSIPRLQSGSFVQSPHLNQNPVQSMQYLQGANPNQAYVIISQPPFQQQIMNTAMPLGQGILTPGGGHYVLRAPNQPNVFFQSPISSTPIYFNQNIQQTDTTATAGNPSTPVISLTANQTANTSQGIAPMTPCMIAPAPSSSQQLATSQTITNSRTKIKNLKPAEPHHSIPSQTFISNANAPVISFATNQIHTATNTTQGSLQTASCMIAPAPPTMSQIIASQVQATTKLKTIKPAEPSTVGTQTSVGISANQTYLTINSSIPTTNFTAKQPPPSKAKQPETRSSLPSNMTSNVLKSAADSTKVKDLVTQRSNSDRSVQITVKGKISSYTDKDAVTVKNTNSLQRNNTVNIHQSSSVDQVKTNGHFDNSVQPCPYDINGHSFDDTDDGLQYPRKAIVKPYINDPNVLTHVIDGYIIHESPSPFMSNKNNSMTGEELQDDDATEEESIANDPQEVSVFSNSQPKPANGCLNCGKPCVNRKNGKKKQKKYCSKSCNNKFNDIKKIKNINSIASTSDDLRSPTRFVEENNNTIITKSEQSTDYSMEDRDGNFLPRSGSNPLHWNVQDVYDFVKNLPGCQEYADRFKSQEIDGQALMLIETDHLMRDMNMKLGPALKICSRIKSLFKAEENKSKA